MESTASAGIVEAREAVALRADPCQRRLGLAAVAPRGGLTAGRGQWLGVLLVPLHDELRDAQLTVQLVRPSDGWFGKPWLAGAPVA